jgi:hypothetical protein
MAEKAVCLDYYLDKWDENKNSKSVKEEKKLEVIIRERCGMAGRAEE